jgi:FtsZ-binding cell division protein ZapB
LSDIHQQAITNVVSRSGFKPSNEPYENVSGMDIGMGQAVPSSPNSMVIPANESISTQMQEIYETINVLAGGIQILNEDTQRLSNESIRIQTSIESLTQAFATLKISIQEQSAFLDGIKPNQEILQQDVASLKQRVDDMQYVSYDGTLTWKITNVQQKMSKFNSQKNDVIYMDNSVFR